MEVKSNAKELELLNRAKEGDKVSFNILLSNNYALVKGYIIKLSGNLSIAEDILQETMLAAVVNIDKFNPRAKFSTWLIAIANNKYKDWLRKNKHELYSEDLYSVNILNENLEDRVIDEIEVKDILKALKNLSYEKRATFILKHYYGYSYEEISGILKCPLGTVRSRLHYCVEKISKIMRGDIRCLLILIMNWIS